MDIGSGDEQKWCCKMGGGRGGGEVGRRRARYRSMNVKGKGCGAAATSSGCQRWVATIQDTAKFSST